MTSRRRASKASTKRRPSTAQIIFYVLSLIIILSIAIGFVIDALIPVPGASQPVLTPTFVILATSTSTATPVSTSPLTPTLEASPTGPTTSSQSTQ